MPAEPPTRKRKLGRVMHAVKNGDVRSGSGVKDPRRAWRAGTSRVFLIVITG